MKRRATLLLALLLALTAVTSRPLIGQQATPPASPDAPTSDDAAIEGHLRALFGQLESLDKVRISVRAGVARLEGEVLSGEARDLAGKLAGETAGVAVVDNRIEEVRDLHRRLGSALDKLRERGLDFVALLPLLVVAILTVGVFYLLSRWIGRWRPRFLRGASSHFVDDLARQALQVAVLLVGVVLALDLLDATALVGAVLGTAGVVGLALGFAFRDTAENTIASILLSARQPFAPNDTVKIEGYEGKVVRLTSRATIVLTFDGNHVRIPNSTVFKGVVVNYSQNPQRRFDFTVGVGTEEDLSAVLQLGTATLVDTPGVLADPPPLVLVESLGDSAVQLHAYGWIDQREASLVKVKSEAIRRLKEAYDAAGVAMPEPIVQLRGLPAAGEAAPAPRAEKTPARARTPTEPADIAPETHTDRQVQAERASAAEVDLLDPAAPKE